MQQLWGTQAEPHLLTSTSTYITCCDLLCPLPLVIRRLASNPHNKPTWMH